MAQPSEEALERMLRDLDYVARGPHLYYIFQDTETLDFLIAQCCVDADILRRIAVYRAGRVERADGQPWSINV